MILHTNKTSLLQPSKKVDNKKKFEIIDQNICDEIDRVTAENSQIWTSPEYNRREYVHSFFQYPAMMVPVVQKKIIEIIISFNPNMINALDPFMGSGTTLVACMENGLNCYGQDINPLAVLVAKTRTGPFFISAIKRKKEQLFNDIENDSSPEIAISFTGLDKWFQTDVAKDLSKIYRAILKEKNIAIRRFYWVILAETVRLTSNDRTSTFKLHVRPEKEIKNRKVLPIDYFKKHFSKCLEDVESYSWCLLNSNKLSKGHYKGSLNINLLDSKESIFTPNHEFDGFDLLVTSPPYGDNKTTVTYGQHSFLPLQWIELHDIDKNANQSFLKTTSEIDRRGIGGSNAKMQNCIRDKMFSVSPTLKSTYIQILGIDTKKCNKVLNFFNDMFLTIDKIYTVMKNNSFQVWTIGNRTVAGIEIRNDKILCEYLKFKGAVLVKRINREILNRRMAKRNSISSLMTCEDILIFRKNNGEVTH